MALTTIKETVELSEVTLDAEGNAFIQKRINLKEGMCHELLQTDLFEDAYLLDNATTVLCEFAISPYPCIPTNMPFFTNPPTPKINRFPSAGSDSILFKANSRIGGGFAAGIQQFPSLQIAANQQYEFYTDHIFINIHIMGDPLMTYENFAWSFLFTVNHRKVPSLTHSLGVLAESHDAMCALVMSNGHMISKSVLRGNTFPMWRYGGIVPEHMASPLGTGGFFLEINTLDNENMQTAAQVRSAIADARQMQPFDQPQGDRFPDWILMGLNQGLVSGPVRDSWPPQKYYNNGNTRMF